MLAQQAAEARFQGLQQGRIAVCRLCHDIFILKKAIEPQRTQRTQRTQRNAKERKGKQMDRLFLLSADWVSHQ
jgi:hypothetical protein